MDIIDLLDRMEERTDPSLPSGGKVLPGVVTCEAGCDGAPGKVVYAAAIPPPKKSPSPLQQASLVDQSIEAAPKPFEATCLAGCFDEPAWKHPRNRPARPPAVVMASLAAPTSVPVDVPRKPLSAKPRKPHKVAKAARRSAPRAARLTTARTPSVASILPNVVKKRPAKRFVAAKKVRFTIRKARHKIIRPAIQYPPRPLPAVVRAVTARSSPARRPDAPLGPFATTIVYSEPRKVALETPSVTDLARRALRDRALRQSLADVSEDWLNRAKRDAAPVLHVR